MIDKNDTTPSPNGDNGGRDARRYDRNSDASARLDDLVCRQVNPKEWAETTGATLVRLAQQYQEADAVTDPMGMISALAAIYRLGQRAALPKRTALVAFHELILCLMLAEAADRLDRLMAREADLREKYGWPPLDANGEGWDPEDHVSPLPEDYAALLEEYGRMGANAAEIARDFRTVCRRHGVEDIADLSESNPAEYNRRIAVGRGIIEAFGEVNEEQDDE